MSQIKIYGLGSHLKPLRKRLSDVLHGCIVTAFQYPENKRAHRFFHLDKQDFYYPEGRSDKYTIIEISLFEGRSKESKKHLYRLIFEHFEKELQIMPNDIEITLSESPLHNWGLRGKPGDEISFDYKISV